MCKRLHHSRARPCHFLCGIALSNMGRKAQHSSKTWQTPALLVCLSSAWLSSQQYRNIHSFANSCSLYRIGSICLHATSIFLGMGYVVLSSFVIELFQPHTAELLQVSCSALGEIAAVGRDSPIFFSFSEILSC